MDFLWWKIVMTPALVCAVTLIGRRFGDRAAGCIVALPLTSGPISVFLALQEGPLFAASAATGTLLGWVAVTAFCVAYARAARRSGPLASSAVSFAVFCAVAWALGELAPKPIAAFVLALACAALALRATGAALALRATGATLERQSIDAALGPRAGGAPPGIRSRAKPPRFDLVFRMAATTGLVLAVTGGASALGPTASGILSPFPVFAGTLAVFAHADRGAGAATELLRGVLAGGFAFASFFVVVALGLAPLGELATYPLAAATALGVGGIAVTGALRPGRVRDRVVALDPGAPSVEPEERA